MILKQLIAPESIVIVGASNNVMKPGGKVLKNILRYNFKGRLYAMNPKEDEVQGIRCYHSPEELPGDIDLAIIAVPSKLVPKTVEFLATHNGTKAFIVLSAGFSETGEEGKALEQSLLDYANANDLCLIGPNCMGVLNPVYAGYFGGTLPRLDPGGVDFVSGSGATAVFIMEAGIDMGMSFASMYTVGNSAQNGVEDILKYWDEAYDPATSAPVKLLYMEKIDQPELFLRHAQSLIRKGCKIAAIKAGASEAGNRAASSHTGALASSNEAVEALFRKAGVVRCEGREDLMLTAAIFLHPELQGDRLAIVTHAGGPGVMLADTLSKGGFKVPPITGPVAEELLTKLFPGSSVANPVDFLATGTADQLGIILDTIDTKVDDLDGIAVIFGTPGLTDVTPVYRVLDEKMKICKKPIWPILPSVITAKDAMDTFKGLGRCCFTDEVLFGKTLARVFNRPTPMALTPEPPSVDLPAIRELIGSAEDGYLPTSHITGLLDAAGIGRVREEEVDTDDLALSFVDHVGYPVVMKVVGPVHKTDVGGVVLNVDNDTMLRSHFARLMDIEGARGVLVQPMLRGQELFIGATAEPGFGHVVLCGLGGVYIEMFRDVTSGLAPIGKDEALAMADRLRSRALFKGVRGLPPISKDHFAELITRVSALLAAAPEIQEMDLNPLIASGDSITAVDARIRIARV